MGILSGMKDAKRGFASNRLTEGDYIARIDRCDLFETDISGNCYKITMTILAAVNGPHKEGELVTHTISDKRASTKKQWLGNIKSFIGTVMVQPDEKIGEPETLRTLFEVQNEKGELVPGENVLGGTVIRLRAVLRASKKSKDPQGNPYDFCVPTWAPALTNEEIAKVLKPEQIARHFPNGL